MPRHRKMRVGCSSAAPDATLVRSTVGGTVSFERPRVYGLDVTSTYGSVGRNALLKPSPPSLPVLSFNEMTDDQHVAVVLPSKEDRLALYRTVLASAESVLVQNHGLPPPSPPPPPPPTSKSSSRRASRDSFTLNEKADDDDDTTSASDEDGHAAATAADQQPAMCDDPKPISSITSAEIKLRASRERYRRRSCTVLREDIPNQVGTYLGLSAKDCRAARQQLMNGKSNADEATRRRQGEGGDASFDTSCDDNTCNITRNQPSDPLGCIALLLANHIIHCDERGYDARVRSIIKMASVHILAKEMKAKGWQGEQAAHIEELQRAISSREQGLAGSTAVELADEDDTTSSAIQNLNIDTLESFGSFMQAEMPDTEIESAEGVTTDAAITSAGSRETTRADPVDEVVADASKSANSSQEEPKCEEEKDIVRDIEGEAPPMESIPVDIKGKPISESTPIEPPLGRVDHEPQIDSRTKSIHFLATRKFEEIEKAVARKLYQILLAEEAKKKNAGGTSAGWQLRRQNRLSVVRGIQIGLVAVGAGALLGVTGGAAAPGIAAGIAALGLGTTAALTTLTSSVMLATLFGVGGGSLAMYKMHKRTGGITEFRVRREGHGIATGVEKDQENVNDKVRPPELRSSICISGWLVDLLDFQRPWGITPTDPPLKKKLELLKRFYSVHDPEMVAKAEENLEKWKDREDELWKDLRKRYGTDPDNLLPIHYEALEDTPLTQKEDEVVCKILANSFVKKNETEEDKKDNGKKADPPRTANTKTKQAEELALFLRKASFPEPRNTATSKEDIAVVSYGIKRFEDDLQPSSAWDFLSLYGGELYTVTWESKQLMSICAYANKLALQLAGTASKEVFQQTLTSAIFMGATLPMTVLFKLQDLIDEPWTLITIRADEAGVELAKALLQSEEHKPITLVGYSFGARIIYSCLKELARRQEIWEKQEEAKRRQEEEETFVNDERNEEDEPLQQDNDADSSSISTLADLIVDANRVDMKQRSSPPQKTSTSKVEKTKSESTNVGNITFSREPASIIEDVVVMGLPQFIDISSWLEFRRVVCGRLINCYSKNDWILSLMFQLKNASAFRATCGTASIGLEGVESVDISRLITTHSNYCTMVQPILRSIGYGEPKMMDVE